jgi:GTPase SAR1 family protein
MSLDFRILVLGDYKTGKSSIVANFVNESESLSVSRRCSTRMLSPDFSELYSPTIGARHHSLTLALGSNFSGGRNIHLTIIDTSGNDKYRRVLSSDRELIESISGILIVFDVTSRNSLESVAGW